MNSPIEAGQRIGRLAPLAEVFAAVDRCAQPVRPHERALADARGCVLPADVLAPSVCPAGPVAERDGWAVRAELLADAGPYAPIPLVPIPDWVESGAALPSGCDAVLPPEALVVTPAGADAIAPVAPGEGVRPPGSDTDVGEALLRAGQRLRASDLALLEALQITEVSVRVPHIAVVAANARVTATAHWISAAIARAGGRAEVTVCDHDALSRRMEESTADALFVVGGTGQGRTDRSALALVAVGRLTLHGMGIRPGQTAGLGLVGMRPVLLLPGRIDAALATWLLVGRRLFGRLAGFADDAGDVLPRRTLQRKIASTIGLAEVLLVGHRGDGIEPLAAGSFPLRALAQAVGWVLVPPESEGYPSGSTIAVNPLL